jgi:two-component system, NtrC family, response regulator
VTKLLIIEDQQHIRTILRFHLQKHDYSVDEAPNLKIAAGKLMSITYDAIILDLKLPDGNGISLFQQFPNQLASRTIVVTANPSIPSVVEAMQKGAFYYLEKPIDKDLLSHHIKNIIQLNSLKQDQQILKDEIAANFTFDNIIHQSKTMTEIIARAKVLAKTDNTILILGDTGSGKEVFANAIHNSSRRNNNRFLPINCASIPGDLFESELFGFEKGAFTGAGAAYGGRFIQADKGTLFLDEIGELPINIQAKLLRVLEERKIYPLKSKQPVDIDVRLITATNRSLLDEIKLKQFRSDLFYRLKESSIVIPPLKERIEDILPLTRHFIHVYNRVYNKEVSRLSGDVEHYFLTQSWDGNVRELKNTIKSIIPFKTDHIIRMDDLSYFQLGETARQKNHVLSLEESEKKHISKILKLTGFNILRTAELLGISRPRLYRKMKSYDLQELADNGNK